jgi:pyridoxamine 5'-phosphate oxidase
VTEPIHPTAASDPFEVFRDWQAKMEALQPPYPDAVVLATASLEARPSARMVLMKGVEEGAFWFFTNYESRKARELETNPHAALLFFWPSIERQVRIEGRVERLPSEVSDRYFASRPRESQLSAIVSPQSSVVDWKELTAERERAEREHAERPLVRPNNWGGYRLLAETFEFWISRPKRFHERHAYHATDQGWRHEELAP